MKKVKVLLTVFCVLCFVNVVIGCHNLDIQYGVENSYGWLCRVLLIIAHSLLTEAAAIFSASIPEKSE